MKTNLWNLTLALSFLTLISASPWTAQAAHSVAGSRCGLADMTSDMEWSKDRNLAELSNAQLLSLPKTLQSQLIIVARENASVMPDEDRAQVRDVLSAMRLLRRWTTSNDVLLSHATIDGTRFARLVSYPGENEYGVIFFAGTDHLAATIGDSEIICAD